MGRKPISQKKASELIELAMPPPPEHASNWTLRMQGGEEAEVWPICKLSLDNDASHKITSR